MTRKLKDVVKGIPDENVPVYLREISKKLHTLATSFEGRVPRTNESLVLANLGKRNAIEIERLASFYPSPIEGLAWCTRNLFELNLILRFVLTDPKNVGNWAGQLAGDEIQILEGILSLAQDGNKEHIATVKGRLAELAAICKRHDLEPSKPFRIDDLAKAVGLSDDYKGLYKLFSKYVHPSSWLVNNSELNAQDNEARNIFIIHAQLYSLDAFSRLDKWFRERSATH